jgi:hypothetical protein
MTYEGAVEFLDANKVEQGIRSAQEAGAIIFAYLLDLEKFSNTGEEDAGIVILSTSRRRNIKLLTETEHRFVPLGVARYVGAEQRLELRPRKHFESDHAVVTLFMTRCKEAMAEDPTLKAVALEWAAADVNS